ncbi:MAG: hypothetical protein ABIE03_03830 [Patescibacteria group bacterium]
MSKIIVIYILLFVLFAVSYGPLGIGVFNLIWLTAVFLRKKLK